jgi:hypothetical protein
MIGIFVEQTPLQIQALQKAIGALDYLTVYKTTHTLRNTIGFFGLVEHVGEQLLDMEKMSRAADGMDRIEAHFSKVQPVLEEAVRELRSMDISTLSLT